MLVPVAVYPSDPWHPLAVCSFDPCALHHCLPRLDLLTRGNRGSESMDRDGALRLRVTGYLPGRVLEDLARSGRP